MPNKKETMDLFKLHGCIEEIKELYDDLIYAKKFIEEGKPKTYATFDMVKGKIIKKRESLDSLFKVLPTSKI